MTFVTCSDCQNFKPDTVGDAYGVGECAEYTAYLSKNPSEEQKRRALSRLGNHNGNTLFWGGRLKDRICEKFQKIEVNA